MTLETDLKTTVDNDATVTAIQGTKFFPLTVQQNAELPYSTYFNASGTRINSLSGDSKTKNVLIQIDAFSDSYSECRDLIDAIQNAITSEVTLFKALTASEARDFYEDSLPAFRISMDFSIWYQE